MVPAGSGWVPRFTYTLLKLLFKKTTTATVTGTSSPVPLLDLYFVSFPYPVVPIVSSAGGIVSFIYLLFAEPITTLFGKLQAF